ncbi:MAG: hypothetical protein JNM84_17120, partial [Planctomycetes bacterium]|nr:hypothetical protein [Planctomycetota bacterium]
MADRAPRWRSSLVVGAGLLAFAVLLFVVRPGTEEPARVAENSPELRAPGAASMEASSSPAIAQRETESAAATRDASSTGDLLVRILDANAEPVSDLAVTLEVERQSAERARPELLYASTWSSAERDASDAIAIPADEVEGALRRARHVRADGFAVELRVRLAFATPRCTRYVCEDLDAMPRSLALQLEGSGFLRIEAVTPEGSPFEGALHARVRARAAPDAGDPGARRFVGTRE